MLIQPKYDFKYNSLIYLKMVKEEKSKLLSYFRYFPEKLMKNFKNYIVIKKQTKIL